MKFEVPQFIEIEDKIFGPLTWRQFLYLGGGLGMGVMIFIVSNWIVFLIIGLPLALLSGALAFYPINNRPFSFFLEAIVNYVRGQKLYLWKRKEQEVHKYQFAPKVIPSESVNSNIVSGSTKSLTTLSRRLELEALQKTE
jgi:hypothetical protein